MYALTELGSDWIITEDRTTDPLATRVLRLVLLMAFGAALMATVLLLVWMFSR